MLSPYFAAGNYNFFNKRQHDIVDTVEIETACATV